jgi:hypothetical protein
MISFTYIRFILLTVIILISFLPLNNNFSLTDLDKASMFEDEICSYNGIPNSVNDTWVYCECQLEFSNDTALSRKINGVPVQCSYEKKRRFIALFLSIFLPVGVDHLYLGNYYFFIMIFFLCWLNLIGNCFRFAVSPHTDYLKNRINLLFVILATVMTIWWIINIALIWSGNFKDGNGVETVDDLNFLINLNN